MGKFQGDVWPEQEAVIKWMRKHGVEIIFSKRMELIKAVTQPRLDAQQRVTELEEALRFYANDQNYGAYSDILPGATVIDADNGKLAREALGESDD